MAALDDLEARVAALEADRFDYRAVLAAVRHASGLPGLPALRDLG